ncbi:transcriptional regulator, LuxR family [Arsukibacterium tuosuense]|uniref:Transcriptional regulator, LuxR family n=1 Tax=Arsukibacterium tuosuense TaxID=1323745 RepID=A0A285I036_9GAMM|nr:response regulator transcription factor [Arsukibacterium tuosuense]SNY41340.1 transcriptional regulator, LuxR family [Arsukibacterium tuosuense]
MERFSRLIILSEREQLHNTAMLAQSVGIKVQQCSRTDFMQQPIKSGVLVGCQFNSHDLTKKGVSSELAMLMQRCPVFIFQAERALIDPSIAVHSGLRGLIYRDEQLDRVLTALKTLMSGQLYYSRTVMSDVVDLLINKPKKLNSEVTAAATAQLTRQEKRIIGLVAEGARNKEIAELLNISAHTVKAHLSAIFRKTQARNRVELLRWLQQSNLIIDTQPEVARFA